MTQSAKCSPAEVESLYAQLRALAQSYLRNERTGHTLQATALVHEAWLRLLEQRQLDWLDRGHVQALAANMMRRILVDHARAHATAKRGGASTRLPLEEVAHGQGAAHDRVKLGGVDLLELEEALEKLATVDPVQVRVVELRFFGSLPLEQIATVLGMGRRSVDRAWACAQAWLYRELEELQHERN